MAEKKWDVLAGEAQLKKTAAALEKKGFAVLIAADGKEAAEKIRSLIPKGSVVMENASVTLEEIGISKEIQDSGNYVSAKKAIWSVSDKIQRDAARKQYSIVDYSLGSAHAVTEQGDIVIASNTGSQIPTYSFNADKVIFVVGTQKLVKNIDEAFERLEKYVIPLEDVHMMNLYKMHTAMNKVLIVRGEHVPARITVIFVKEKLGF